MFGFYSPSAGVGVENLPSWTPGENCAHHQHFHSLYNQAADATEDQDGDDLPPLNSLYSEGDMVASVVVLVSKEGVQVQRDAVFRPSQGVAGRLSGVGELCTAALESKEDHWYIMDIGS